MRAAPLKIIQALSPYFTNHTINPILIVLHCIGYNDPLAVLNATHTSAHYLIPTQNDSSFLIAYEVVVPPFEAWQAGVSAWKNLTGVNKYSLGIENSMPDYAHALDNTTLNFFYFQPFQPQQMQALVILLKQLMAQFNILPWNVIAHSDIAPWRNISGEIVVGKTDPGPTFPWEWLASQGIGIWPEGTACSSAIATNLTAAYAQQKLNQIGYSLPQSGLFDLITNLTLGAFRIHWAPECYNATSGLATACYEKEFDGDDACRLYQVAAAFEETSSDSSFPSWAIITISVISPILLLAVVSLLYRYGYSKNTQESQPLNPDRNNTPRSNVCTSLNPRSLFGRCKRRQRYQELHTPPRLDPPRRPSPQQSQARRA